MRSLIRIAVPVAALVGSLLAGGSALAGPADGPVVRPQLYSAGNKFEFSPMVGYVSNDPYYRIITPGAMLSYHYSDRSAIEAHIGYDMNSAKQLLSQVRQKISRDPDVVSRPKFFVTGNYSWTPIYGKLDAFGEIVAHYDLYVLGGLGICQDEIETNTTTTPSSQSIASKVFPVTDVAIGQHFFLSRHVGIRAEVRPVITWENINNKWDPNGDVEINVGLTFLL